MAEPIDNQKPVTAQAPQQGPSLFQQLQQNLAKLAQPAQAPGQILGQTEALQRISQAAAGTAAPTGQAGPARSRQAERAVVDQVKRGQEELNRQFQMDQLAMGQQERAIQEEAAFKNKLLSEDQLVAREKFLDTQKGIIQEYTTGQRQLDLNKDKSKLEQLGFSMRLSNDKYLNDLEKQARLANLSDEIQFEEEMYRSIFADEEELFRNDLEFRSLLNADERTFKDELAQISIDTALDLAKAENRALSERQMWEGLATTAEAGAFAYSKFGGSKE